MKYLISKLDIMYIIDWFRELIFPSMKNEMSKVNVE